MTLKNFQVTPYPDCFKDVLHADGSKTYDTCYGKITIQRPEVVSLVEQILSQSHLGYDYHLTLEGAFKTNRITFEEYQQIFRILD
jgi:hypothetical protein